jgi:DNA-directed RNA polymerase specialized sigma24 family protein
VTDIERKRFLAAREGDQKALSDLLRAAEPEARKVVRLLVGQPDDCSDLVQEAMVDAFTSIAELPENEPFKNTLQTLAIRKTLEFMALQRRWRPSAQIKVEDLCESHGMLGDVADALWDPETEFNPRSHVAYCFSAVGRSMPFEEQVVLLLVDALGWTKERVAETLRMRIEDVIRYAERARDNTNMLFDRLCGLANDKAPCDHCRGLWNVAPRKGENPESMGLDANNADDRLRRRLRIVRDAPLDRGTTHKLHDVLYRLMAPNEANRDTPKEEDDQLPETRSDWQGLLDVSN